MRLRFCSVLAVAVGLMGLLVLCANGWANPIAIPPYDFHGTLRIDNDADYPGVVFLWTVKAEYGDHRIKAVDPTQSLHWQSGLTSPWVMPQAVYDSVYAMLRSDSAPQPDFVAFNTFLKRDPRVLRSNVYTPRIDMERNWMWCREIEDVFHIDRLDSAHFKVTLVKAVYHLRDGTISEVRYSPPLINRLLHRSEVIRPLPLFKGWVRVENPLEAMRALPPHKRWLQPGVYYAGLSLLASLAFATAIVIRNRRRHA